MSYLSDETLVQLAQEYGTPLYVYNANQISEQYNKLQYAFKKVNARFFYACKALSNINVLKYIESLGASLDCVSIHEVQLGLKAGFTPDRILFTPNCVDFAEVDEGKKLGVN
ncbi:MAG: diaminopimelate decarboxylase, partial [Flavihumibacter sp.]|nr:diaminopimelate decarboxylase [Flavihumibacter sp.]